MATSSNSTVNSSTTLQAVTTPSTSTVTLANDSAYQLTPIYTNPSDGNLVFGLRIQAMPRNSDRLVNITMATANRPDTVSNFYQGDASLWWLLADLSQFLDPLLDFQQGVQVRFSPAGLNR